MQLITITILLEELVGELYDAEHRLISALPQVIERVCHPALKEAITRHYRQSSQEIERLERVGRELHCSIDGVHCGAVEGFVERLEEFFRAAGVPAVRDAALLAVLQQIQRYEISTYQSAADLAQLLGLHEIHRQLLDTLREEENQASSLNDIAVRFIYPDALQVAGESWGGDMNLLERVSYRR
jgi:ferritin-like metal-binding protein YciE